MNDILEWTEQRIDALEPGRELDVLIATHVMKRKAKYVKGEPCAWDGDQKPVMWAPPDWLLEDYDPARDGISGHTQLYNPRVVFNYSLYDSGMTRVMDFLRQGAAGLTLMSLVYDPAAGAWSFTIRWKEPGRLDNQAAVGRDPELARLAVYRASLKAMLIP